MKVYTVHKNWVFYDGWIKTAESGRRLWNRLYAESYDDVRKDVSDIVSKYNAVPVIRTWNDPNKSVCGIDDDDWVCFADNDDINLESIVRVVERHKDSCDVIWANTVSVRIVDPVVYSKEFVVSGRVVPHASGVVYRYGSIKKVDSDELIGLIEDHAYTVTHAVRLGLKVARDNEIIGAYIVHPGSLTVIAERWGSPSRVNRVAVDYLKKRGCDQRIVDCVQELVDMYISKEIA